MSETWESINNRLDALNIKKGIFASGDKFEIPIIKRQEHDVEKLVPFGKKQKDGYAHFFMHDYAFERLWNKPKKYINQIKQYPGICSPDFSPYDDWPLAIQIYNVYRNRWVGRYYQEMGAKVIPTITWSGPRSFEFALEGVEPGSTVIVSTVGLGMQPEYLELFYEGYDLMQKKLKPELVLVYTNFDVDLYGDFKLFKGFAVERLRQLDKKGDE